MKKLILFVQLFLLTVSCSQGKTRVVPAFGYDNCVEITNGSTRVIIDPNCGGRVLAYELNGVNVLQTNAAQNGFIADTTTWADPVDKHLSGGRFDIGPEKIKPDTRLFWYGKWQAQITGKLSARLTSGVSRTEQLQVVRDFELDEKTSKLTITQTIINSSTNPRKLCFWSRTFAEGGGIAIVPLSVPNRFPAGYINYDAGNVMLFKPEPEENIRIENDIFYLLGPVQRPKFVYDSNQGWVAYITKSDRLFIKKYAYDENWEYGEMTASPLSIWYNGEQMTEIEPIGPWEWIEPGSSTQYSEVWYLYEHAYPTNKIVDIETVKQKVDASL
jgi:hypothetical protein